MWDEFFHIFDIKRRRLASFEYHVKQLNNKDGFVDLFWPATLIVEHKSKGKSLDKAHAQVLDYFHGIPDKQLPQYILASDFARFRLYDLDNNIVNEFTIDKLIDNIGLFGFIAGYQKRTYKEQDPVNIEAAELMGRLHDKLKDIGYEGHALELYLVRLVFLLFADDTNIFEKGVFYDYLDLTTEEDGSDLAATLAQLFEVLNTPKEKRLRNINESLNAFRYVNGKLFEEHLPTAAFDSQIESNEFINGKKWVKGRFGWQEGYSVFSYSHSHIDKVINYISNQETHHKKRTFRQEYHEMLDKFEIPFEENYLFDFF